MRNRDSQAVLKSSPSETHLAQTVQSLPVEMFRPRSAWEWENQAACFPPKVSDSYKVWGKLEELRSSQTQSHRAPHTPLVGVNTNQGLDFVLRSVTFWVKISPRKRGFQFPPWHSRHCLQAGPPTLTAPPGHSQKEH